MVESFNCVSVLQYMMPLERRENSARIKVATSVIRYDDTIEPVFHG
jgi:hypothetical protein